MPEPVRKQASCPDGNVSYLAWEAGSPSAPVLHFAHANGFNAQTYRTLLSPLAGPLRILASDARGHGMTMLPTTPGLPKDWTIFQSDLLALLDQLCAGPVILAGHSMGAIASLMVAAARPDRVRGLVLAEPVLVPRLARYAMRLARLMGRTNPGPDLAERALRRREKFASFEQALTAYRGRGAFKSWQDESVADYLEGGLLPTDDGGMRLACTPAWEAEDFRSTPMGISRLASKLRCPVTLIHGQGTASPREVATFARHYPATRIVKVEGASHFLPMEWPDIVREEITRLAASL